MTSDQVEIQLIASLVAVSCSLPGVFLLLRGMSMMSDAISHSILLGIVLVFLIVGDLSSPILILGAALSGILTVLIIDLIDRKRFVSKDSSIGLVFPFFFSVGVILISMFAWNVHLDTDAVLLGELAFAPFERIYMFGRDLGPKSFYVVGTIVLINVIFITLFYKELKLSTFDPSFAEACGFRPRYLHLALMIIVSLTCVGVFDAVGSILVVAFMVVPACCAYLVSNSLSRMILFSVVIGIVCSITGYWVSHFVNANIGGSIAVVCGVVFLALFIATPGKGYISRRFKKKRQMLEFAHKLLLVHLLNHEGSSTYQEESHIEHLYVHMSWSKDFGSKVIEIAQKEGDIVISGDNLFLTEKGRKDAKSILGFK